MGIPDIKTKLKSKLSKTEYEESDVVYFLVEMYKFLEQENKLKDYKFIVFYRNWVCHSALDTNPNIDVFFSDIKKEIISNNLGIDVDTVDKVLDHLPKTVQSFSFKKLKEDIDKFSANYLDNLTINWNIFRESLYQILIGQPLKINIKLQKQIIFEYEENINSGDNLDIKIKLESHNASAHYSDLFIDNL